MIIKRKFQFKSLWLSRYLLLETSGQTLVEYSLILLLVAILCVIALSVIGLSTGSHLNQVANNFTNP